MDWPEITKSEDHVGKNYTKMNHPILWKLNQKISLATQFKSDAHTSGTYMQVANYGLGGLIELHIDPMGIMEMDDLSKISLKHLEFTGDEIGTFMAWLDNTEAGGGTTDLEPAYKMSFIMKIKSNIPAWARARPDPMGPFQCF